MSEIGMEAPKIGIGQRIKETFSGNAAKEAWYRKNAELVKKYTDVNNGLSDEQRAQAVAQIEADATKSADSSVRGHWLALAATTATLAVATVAVVKPELAGRLADTLSKSKIGSKLKLDTAARGVEKGAFAAHNFLKDLPINAKDLAGKARNFAVEKGTAVFEAVKKIGKKPGTPQTV